MRSFVSSGFPPCWWDEYLLSGHSVPGTVLGTGMWQLLETHKPPALAPAVCVGDLRQQGLNREGGYCSCKKAGGRIPGSTVPE